MKADTLFLDLAVPHWMPRNGTMNQLVHAEAARERLQAAAAAQKTIIDALEPVVAAFCSGLAARPCHLGRHIRDAPNSGV